MTKKELTSMTNKDLVGHFDYVCTKLTHEEGSVRGVTKKTTEEYKMTRDELLKRLEGTKA